MKKPLIILAFSALIFAGVFWSCMKDDIVYLDSSQSYKNLTDNTTTDLIVSIPRIEYSTKKSSTGITLYTSVTDQDGKAIREFNEHNFKLSYMCKGKQEIIEVKNHKSVLNNNGKKHMAVALTMDYSGRMSQNDIFNMENALKQFIRHKDANDYLQIIKFASNVMVMNQFSNDTTLLINRAEEIVNVGTQTACNDAIYHGLNNTDQFISNRPGLIPVVLAFADGLDNNSVIMKTNGLINMANQKQIPIYTIGFGNVDAPGMNRMADETGGRYFYKPGSDGVDELYDMISGQLENIYGLTFEYSHMECDELTIIVEVTYENQHGVLSASATRDFLLE